MEEGVIKYKLNWQQNKIEIDFNYDDIISYRQKCFDKNWIGYDEKYKVGFGNISERISNKQFIISGSQTGHLENLNETHFSLVENFDIEKNELNCIGESKASSESLTHAAIYKLSNKVKAVIHIHHSKMWKRYFEQLPTSNKLIQYGTPEMAFEIQRLYNEGQIVNSGILLMGGHQDGIIAWADSFKSAFDILEQYETN